MTNVTNESGHSDSASAHKDDSRDEAVVEHIKDHLFSSDFIFATLACFIITFSSLMMFATLPVYVLINLGGSQADVGMACGTLPFTALLFRPFVGWLTDTLHRRPTVLIGISCYGLANVVYLVTGSIPLLMLGLSVNGFGLCCYTTAANAYVADIAPLKQRAEAMGLFAAAQAVGIIIGPVVGFFLVGTLGFVYLFAFSGVLAGMAFLVSLFTQEPRQLREIKRRPWSPRTGVVAIESLPAAWMALCMGMGFGTLYAFIAIFAAPRGLQNPGIYFMVQAIALLISRMLAGRLADRYGRTVVIIPGILLMTISLALLPLAHGFAYFVISAALFGLGFGTAQPAIMALLIDQVRPERRGLATSTYFIGYDAGNAIGAIGMGMVSQLWGFGVMWPLVAACTLLGLAGLLANRRHVTAAAQ
jgi:MFS family permease